VSFGRRRSWLAMMLVLALVRLPAHASSSVEDKSEATRITEIALERDCPGCLAGSVLTLRSDGAATYAVTGKSRFGSDTKVSKGSVSAADFKKVARLIVERGFFGLDDQYDDSAIKDGAWTTTRVTRDGQDKSIFRRDGSGPAALRDVERAIDAVKGKIEFAPKISEK